MGRITRKDRILFLIITVGIILLIQSSTQITNFNVAPKIHYTIVTEKEFGEEKVSPIRKSQSNESKQNTTGKNTGNGNTVQEERLNTLRAQCQKMGANYKGSLPDSLIRAHLLHDERNKLVFCDLPKVGSTFLKQVLHIITGHKKVKNPFKITGDQAHTIPFDSFEKLSIDEALKTLRDSTKFLFVRNPYTRILSGYVDKLFTTNFVFWDTTGKLIVKRQRKNPSKKSVKCGHDSTFPEFIRHVIFVEKEGKYRNPHWFPMFDTCRPCNLNYDVIGKIETFQDDLQQFLKSQNLSHMVNISTMNQENDQEAISLTINRAYQTIKKKQNCLTLSQSLERAWKVLQIRGILSHKADFPYGKIRGNPNIKSTDFLRIINAQLELYPMKNADKILAREQALVKAWRSVSLEDLKQFQTLYHPDFVVFNYNKVIPKRLKDFEAWEPFKLKL